MVIEETGIVTRTINVDFIYLDLIFLCIWITFLMKKRYTIAMGWGIFGIFVYILVDFVLWHLIMQSRTYEGPLNEYIFFIWFTASPGFVQTSYVMVMLEKRNKHELIFWTLLFYIGWTLVAVGSQYIPLDDRIIRVARNMNAGRQRLIDSILALINLGIALILYKIGKIRGEDVIYIFIVGTLVEFCLEFTLTISGIRLEQGTWSPGLMLVDTFIEYNLGIMFSYALFLSSQHKRFGIKYKHLSWKDRNEIKTNFNIIAVIAQFDSFEEAKEWIMKNKKLADEVTHLYSEEDLKHDYLYYKEQITNKAKSS